ncbi:hypothetical protein QCD70_07465 [Agreia sp. PsM10]|uniref:hypothetical protein n=1 Tax=Agreia sp. PsM10 TaxID=3030533 RepID=UPI00263BE0D1|nr:hypothetical protein [Agreia sp. PsM10]MDN4640077.1 hypothetical protein [Agreia sp. PsM10]
MSTAERDRTRSRPQKQAFLQRYEGPISSFADCLVVGIMVLLTFIPLVTGFAGFVAGCAILRARTRGEGKITPAAFWREFRAALRSSAGVVLIPAALGVLLVVDLFALYAGLGENPVMWIALGVVSAVVAVLGIRAAAAWRPGQHWVPTLQNAFRALGEDASGSLLLLGALATSIALALFTPMLTIVCLGPLVLGAVAIDTRLGRTTPARQD